MLSFPPFWILDNFGSAVCYPDQNEQQQYNMGKRVSFCTDVKYFETHSSEVRKVHNSVNYLIFLFRTMTEPQLMTLMRKLLRKRLINLMFM